MAKSVRDRQVFHSGFRHKKLKTINFTLNEKQDHIYIDAPKNVRSTVGQIVSELSYRHTTGKKPQSLDTLDFAALTFSVDGLSFGASAW